MKRVDLANCIECGASLGPPRTGYAMRGVGRMTCGPVCKRERKNRKGREARTTGRYDLRRKKENSNLGVGATTWLHDKEMGIQYLVVTRNLITEHDSFAEAREEYALRIRGDKDVIPDPPRPTEKRRTKRIVSVIRADGLEPWAVRERFGLSRCEAERYAELARRSA